MTISSLYHTQGIRGYKYQKTERTADTEMYYLHSKARHLPCPRCQSENTSLVQTGKTRDIYRFKKTIMRVSTRRIVCQDCAASVQEPIDFCPEPYVRYTKWGGCPLHC